LDLFRRVYHVIKTDNSELYPTIDDSIVETSKHKDDYLQFIRAFGVKSAMIVPLKLRKNILGVIGFISTKTEYPYSFSDIVFAEDIAGRAVSAIGNAKLFSETSLLNQKLNSETQEQYN